MDNLIKYEVASSKKEVWASLETARAIKNRPEIKEYIDKNIRDYSIVLENTKEEQCEESALYSGFDCKIDNMTFFFFGHRNTIYIIRKTEHEEQDMSERMQMLAQYEMFEDEEFFKEKYDRALEIATKAHEGQMDKAGRPYIEHPVYVAEHVDGNVEKIVALLHDVVEDSDVTIKEIAAEFPSVIPWAVDVLTNRPEDIYTNYIVRIRNNPLARKVKIEDIKHNMDLSRLSEISEDDERRVEKYAMYLKLLESDYYYEELALGEADSDVRMVDYQIEGYDFHRAMRIVKDAEKERLWKAIEVNNILRDFGAPVYVQIAALLYCCIEMEIASAMGVANHFGEKVWDLYLQMPWNYRIPVEDKTALLEEFLPEADKDQKLILLAIAIAELRELEFQVYRLGKDEIFVSQNEKLRYEEYFATLLEEYEEYEDDEDMSEYYWTHQNLFKDVFVSYHVNKEKTELYQGCDLYCWVWRRDGDEGWEECPVMEFPTKEYRRLSREEAEELETEWAYGMLRRYRKTGMLVCEDDPVPEELFEKNETDLWKL